MDKNTKKLNFDTEFWPQTNQVPKIYWFGSNFGLTTLEANQAYPLTPIRYSSDFDYCQ